jgi:arylsulfatase A-like enzyme
MQLFTIRKILALLVVSCLSCVVIAEPLARPNILILMAEDMSDRVGAFGDEVAVTPNIDQLAKQGVRYPNTFTAAGVCAPSRAAHIMGMHQISFGGQHMRTSSSPL